METSPPARDPKGKELLARVRLQQAALLADQLKLGVRARNWALCSPVNPDGPCTIDELADMREADVLRMKNCGHGTVKEIRSALQVLGRDLDPSGRWLPQNAVRTRMNFDASLRDYFASHSLPALIAKHAKKEVSGAPTSHREIAHDAYLMADAMLVERVKGKR